MTYLEKALARKAQIDRSEAEKAEFRKMLADIKAAAEELSPIPTLPQLTAFLKAVMEILKKLKEVS